MLVIVVGGTIVCEVFLGLLEADSNSYFSVDPTWTPEKETLLKIPQIGDNFELRDIIKFAGMPISIDDLPF